jgi:hypothetical protein
MHLHILNEDKMATINQYSAFLCNCLCHLATNLMHYFLHLSHVVFVPWYCRHSIIHPVALYKKPWTRTSFVWNTLITAYAVLPFLDTTIANNIWCKLVFKAIFFLFPKCTEAVKVLKIHKQAPNCQYHYLCFCWGHFWSYSVHILYIATLIRTEIFFALYISSCQLICNYKVANTLTESSTILSKKWIFKHWSYLFNKA